MLCIAPSVQAQPLDNSVASDRQKTAGNIDVQDTSVLVSMTQYKPFIYARAQRDAQSALWVNFKLASSTLEPNYRNNAVMLDRITSIIRSALSDTVNRVRIIQIVGFASIEGNVAYNERLSTNRALALKRYIQQHVDAPDSLFEIIGGGEAWEELRYQISDALEAGEDHGMAAALEIIDSEPDATRREKRLRALNAGKTYAFIRDSLLHNQRNSGYMRIFIDYAPIPAKPIETPDVEAEKLAEKPVETPPVTPIESKTTLTYDTLIRVSRCELLAVKTNLLFYGIYMPGYNRWCPIPNIALEYYPKRGHFTYGFSFDMPWWQNFNAHKYFQIRNYQLEARYYFRGHRAHREDEELDGRGIHSGGPAYKGFYVQAYANAGIFGICFNADKGWVGEGFGGGIGFGYVQPLSKKGHWKLDFGIQAGFLRCKYDPYQYGDPVDPAQLDNRYYYKWTLDAELFKKRQYRWNWLGPTRIGITLSYDLLYRKHKRGISFRPTELKEAERRIEL